MARLQRGSIGNIAAIGILLLVTVVVVVMPLALFMIHRPCDIFEAESGSTVQRLWASEVTAMAGHSPDQEATALVVDRAGQTHVAGRYVLIGRRTSRRMRHWMLTRLNADGEEAWTVVTDPVDIQIGPLALAVDEEGRDHLAVPGSDLVYRFTGEGEQGGFETIAGPIGLYSLQGLHLGLFENGTVLVASSINSAKVVCHRFLRPTLVVDNAAGQLGVSGQFSVVTANGPLCGTLTPDVRWFVLPSRVGDGPRTPIALDRKGGLFSARGGDQLIVERKPLPGGSGAAWRSVYNPPGFRIEDPGALALDESGNVYLTAGVCLKRATTRKIGRPTCEIQGTATVCFANSGAWQWTAIYHRGNSFSSGQAIGMDGLGGVVVAGGAPSWGWSQNRFLILKYWTTNEDDLKTD